MRVLITLILFSFASAILAQEISIIPQPAHLTKKADKDTIHSQDKYYFASKGMKEGNGTRQQPFTSLLKLSQLALQPGDSVFFRAGDTLTGNVSLNNINGTKQHNIVFTSYGKGKCNINGGNNEAFKINASSSFQIANIRFIGAGRKTGNTTNGLGLVGCKNFTVKDVDVSGFQKSGLELYNCENGEVNRVFAHENGFGGILVDGDYQKRLSNKIHIINSRADDNPGDPTNLDNHSGNGILVGNCKNILIEYCTATNNGWDMPRIGNGPVGIWAYEADFVVIQHCISYRNKTAKGAADGGGFDLDGGVANSIIQYCLSYENWGSGYGIFQYSSASKWNNNTVRYCISVNDGYVTNEATGMYLWNGWNGDSMFTNFYAYNNFFYNDRKYAFGFSTTCQHHNFNFFNNIFIASDTSDIYNGIDSSTNDIFLGNVWMRRSGGFMQNNFTDFKKWSESTGYERHNGKLVGTSFQKKLFDMPTRIDITDPYKVKTSSLLLSLCNNTLCNRGIDIRKMFGIDIGKTDFFGHAKTSKDRVRPGVCY
jgi:hypothetical protein